MTSPVRLTSSAVDAMAEDWQLIEALMGGTRAMRRAGKQYLPEWPAEEAKAYQSRLATATLFPAYARTVSVLTGRPFAKPLTIGEDVPARFNPWLEDVDLQGRSLHVFAADLACEALAFGLAGILVDYPPSTGARTVAEEIQAGTRPYFVHVHHNAILGWRAERRNGAMQLTQLRLLEVVEIADGAFGTGTIEQVRVLEPGSWATWRKVKDDDPNSWAIHEEGKTSLAVIPFVPVYGWRKDFMIGAPPMMELAWANVEHWQSKSDQQTILHVARVPLLFGKDMGPNTDLVVGDGSLITASSADADLKYVEHSGKSIEAGRLSLLDLEDRMRQIGAELLVIKPGNTTEVQVVSENEQGMCDLQRIMQSLENALDQALALMAQWVGESQGGHISIYNDFGAATLAEASSELLFEMREAGSLSRETLLHELKRRGILSADVDVEEEISRALAESDDIVKQERVNV